MLNDNSSPKYLWVEAINIACYLQNKIYIRPILQKTPYGLWKVYNSRTLTVEESIHSSKEPSLDEDLKDNKFEVVSRNGKILGDVQDRGGTRLTFKDQAQVALLSKLEPKNVDERPLCTETNTFLFDDIIFCATNFSLDEEFSKLMQKEFKITMMGQL
ncbi:hypothetical protein CR513_11307, partial [Mucuna pruriens]